MVVLFSKEVWIDVKAVLIHYDNQSAIYIAKIPMYYERMKHIDVKLHFIREIVTGRSVHMVKIVTTHNPADMRTKVVPSSKFRLS